MLNWESITVKQYYEIVDILQKDNQTEGLIKVLFNQEMADIPITRLNWYINQLDFLKSSYKPKNVKNKYLVGDIVVKPVLDIKSITTAQYIDFQELTKRGDYKLLLNCLFIKDGCKYGEEDISDYLWDRLPFSIYSDVLFFFLNFYRRLIHSTLTSSVKRMKKIYRKTKDKQILRQIVTLRAEFDGLI